MLRPQAHLGRIEPWIKEEIVQAGTVQSQGQLLRALKEDVIYVSLLRRHSLPLGLQINCTLK